MKVRVLGEQYRKSRGIFHGTYSWLWPLFVCLLGFVVIVQSEVFLARDLSILSGSFQNLNYLDLQYHRVKTPYSEMLGTKSVLAVRISQVWRIFV